MFDVYRFRREGLISDPDPILRERDPPKLIEIIILQPRDIAK